MLIHNVVNDYVIKILIKNNSAIYFMAKRLKKKIHFNSKRHTAVIYSNKSYTNISVTLTDLKRKVIIRKSSGSSGIEGSKRRKIAPQAIENILKEMSQYFKLYKIFKVM